MKKTKEEILNEYNELNDKYIRSVADYQNYKRNTIDAQHESYNKGRMDMFKEMSDFFDDIARIKAQDENMSVSINIMYDRMLTTLNKAGIVPVCAEIGDKFDTDYHEAVGNVHLGEVPSGHIAAYLSPGWKKKDGNIVSYCKAFVEK